MTYLDLHLRFGLFLFRLKRIGSSGMDWISQPYFSGLQFFKGTDHFPRFYNRPCIDMYGTFQ